MYGKCLAKVKSKSFLLKINFKYTKSNFVSLYHSTKESSPSNK